MKIRAFFVLLAFASTSLRPAGAQVPLVTQGASPHFLAVASKLELGGASFSYAEEGELMAMIGDFLDEVVKGLPESQKKDLPKEFSLRKAFALLGLDSLKASGNSARLLPDGRYHTRTYAHTPEGRKGLLTLTGGPAKRFLTLDLAPAGTDLALEFPLHTKDFAAQTLKPVLEMIPEKERAEANTALDQRQPPLGIAPREMLEQLSARVGLFIRLNPDQKIPEPKSGLEFPGADAALVIEDLQWLLDPLKQQFGPMLGNPQAPVEAVDQDGVLTVKMRGPVGPAPMDFQPSLRYDTKKAQLIVATRPAFLEAMLSAQDKLAKEAHFAQTWAGLPEEGNGSLYLSPRLFAIGADLVRKSLEKQPGKPEEKEVAEKIIRLIEDKLKQPQVFCYANLPQGSYGAANSLFPGTGSGSPLATLSAVSILASLAVPSFNVIQDKAEETAIMNQGRQVAMAVRIWAGENGGNYPAELKTLLKDEILLPQSAGLITPKNTKSGEQEPWLYDNTLTETSPGRSILLAAPFTVGTASQPKRIVVRNDASAEVIPESEFESAKGAGLK